MIYENILKEKLTLINVIQAFYNPLFALHSLIVRTCFSASSSSTSPSFTSSSFCKILFILQTKLEVKEGVVEKLESL